MNVGLKMLLQELCAAKDEWDYTFSEKNHKSLQKWIEDIKNKNIIAVPRHYFLKEKNHIRALWWGGYYARMVQLVKRSLRKILGNA